MIPPAFCLMHCQCFPALVALVHARCRTPRQRLVTLRIELPPKRLGSTAAPWRWLARPASLHPALSEPFRISWTPRQSGHPLGPPASAEVEPLPETLTQCSIMPEAYDSFMAVKRRIV